MKIRIDCCIEKSSGGEYHLIEDFNVDEDEDVVDVITGYIMDHKHHNDKIKYTNWDEI